MGESVIGSSTVVLYLVNGISVAIHSLYDMCLTVYTTLNDNNAKHNIGN